MMKKTCWMLPLLLAASAPAFSETSNYKRIDFQTEAGMEVDNNLLTATLSVEGNNRSPALLAADLTQKLNGALKRGESFHAVRLTSGNQQTWPVYNDKNKPDGWRGRAELRLESQDFKAAGELISQLQGDLQLNNLDFSVSPEARRDAENKLIEQAIAAFRQRAERISGSWGAKSYKLVQMSLGTAAPPGPQPLMMMRSAKAAMGDAAPPADYSGGSSRLVVQASGTIELDP